MKRFIFSFFIILSGCSASPGSEKELSYSCRNTNCYKVDFRPIDKSSYESSEIFYPDGGIGDMLPVHDGWLAFSYSCEEFKRFDVQRSDSPWEGGWEPVKTSSVSRRGSSCEIRVDANEVRNGLRLEKEWHARNGMPYVDIIVPPSNSKVFVRIDGNFSYPVNIQTSRLSSGYAAGRISESLEFDFLAGDDPRDSFVVITTYGRMAEYGEIYEKRSVDLAGIYGSLPKGGDINDVIDEFNGMNLKYFANESNSGVLPKRDIDTIVKSGFVHCMDAAQLGRYISWRHGIEAVPVVTSTLSPMPLFSVAPDHAWMNHVILYFKEENVFVDLTASPGRQIISDGSISYRYLGFDVKEKKWVEIN